MAKDFMEDENEDYGETSDMMSEEEADRILSNLSSDEEAEEDFPQEPDQDFEDQIEEQVNEEEEEAASLEVLTNASLRLEQGNLYKLILTQNLFENTDADPKAVNNVQREIRAFVRERLEVLVGLKEDPRLLKRKTREDFPFTDIEIDLLKTMLGRVTKQAPAIKPISQPVSAKPKQPMKLNTIKGNQTKPSQEKKPTSSVKVVEKIKRPTAQKKKTEDAEGRLKKHPKDMTVNELIEYNKTVAARQMDRKAKPLTPLPQLDSDQKLMHYSKMVNSDAKTSNFVSMVMAKMNVPLGKVENVNSDSTDNFSSDDRI